MGRLWEMVEQSRETLARPAYVYVHILHGNVNKMLENASLQEQIQLLKLLVTAWDNPGDEDLPRMLPSESLRAWQGGRKLMFTLTGTRDQFRCWYGPPRSFRREHVDSWGQNILFDIGGYKGKDPPTVVHQFV